MQRRKRHRFFLFIFLYFFTSCLFASLTWSTPPSEITLEYDQENKILHMELKHVSRDPQEHYIRRVSIYRNGEEILKQSYTHQTNAKGLVEDFPLEFEPLDEVRVLAICRDAGRKEATLIIPEKP